MYIYNNSSCSWLFVRDLFVIYQHFIVFVHIYVVFVFRIPSTGCVCIVTYKGLVDCISTCRCFRC